MAMNIRDLHVTCTYKRTRQWWLNNDDDFWMQNVRLFLDLTKLQLNPGGNLCSPGPTHRSRHQRLSFYSRTIVQWRGVASFLTSCRPGWLSFPHILPWKLHAWLVRTDLTNTLSLFSSPQQRIRGRVIKPKICQTRAYRSKGWLHPLRGSLPQDVFMIFLSADSAQFRKNMSKVTQPLKFCFCLLLLLLFCYFLFFLMTTPAVRHQ